MAKTDGMSSHHKAIATQHDQVAAHHKRQMVHHGKIADHHRALAGGGSPGDMPKSVSTKGGAGTKEKVPTKGPRK